MSHRRCSRSSAARSSGHKDPRTAKTRGCISGCRLGGAVTILECLIVLALSSPQVGIMLQHPRRIGFPFLFRCQGNSRHVILFGKLVLTDEPAQISAQTECFAILWLCLKGLREILDTSHMLAERTPDCS